MFTVCERYGSVSRSATPPGERPARRLGAIHRGRRRGHSHEVANCPRRPFCHASPILGMTSCARAPCALQASTWSSFVVVRLLDAALCRTRRVGAVGRSCGSMEQRGEPVPRDHRVQPAPVVALVAIFQRCRRGLTAALADHGLAQGGPSAGCNVGELGAARQRLGSARTRVFVLAIPCDPPTSGPHPLHTNQTPSMPM